MGSAEPVRLTRLAKRAGCAAKHPPGFLLPLLGVLPPLTDPNVLVGSSTADDAAVYKLSDDLVLTTDFFTPIVDRPCDFGRVAGEVVAALGAVGLTAAARVGRVAEVGGGRIRMHRSTEPKSRTGELTLLDANLKEYKELAKSKVCGQTWAPPALAAGKLHIRDDKELLCLKLAD